MTIAAMKQDTIEMDFNHPMIKKYCSWRAAKASAAVPHLSRVEGARKSWKIRRRKYGPSGRGERE